MSRVDIADVPALSEFQDCSLRSTSPNQSSQRRVLTRLRVTRGRNTRRYDVCKDVQRMERFAHRTRHGAAVLMLSNDPAYWNPRSRTDTFDAAFDLSDARQLSGSLGWAAGAGAGTIRGGDTQLEICRSYPLVWRDYSDLGGIGGRFRYLWIAVADSKNRRPAMSAHASAGSDAIKRQRGCLEDPRRSLVPERLP